MENSTGAINLGYIETESKGNLETSKDDTFRHDKNSASKGKLCCCKIFPIHKESYILPSTIDPFFIDGNVKAQSYGSLQSFSWLRKDQSPSGREHHHQDQPPIINGNNEQLHDNHYCSRKQIDSSTSVMVQAPSKYLQNITKSDLENAHTSDFLHNELDINTEVSSPVSATNNNPVFDHIKFSSQNEFRKKIFIWGRRGFKFSIKYGLTYPFISFILWALLYIFWSNMALPGGSLFALIILLISAISLGHIAGLLCLPPLLGMLAAGLILRNVPCINVAKDLTLSISSPLRGISVVILLTRGGFSVNPSNIKKLWKVVPSLAIGSCIIEAIIGALSVYFIIGFSSAWAILMGCIMSAMSGAVVMPYLIHTEKAIRSDASLSPERILIENSKMALTISKTACGLDAILAICMAEFSLGFIFGSENLNTSLLKGPAEVAMGGAFAVLWGGTSGLLLYEENQKDLRVIAVFSGGVMSLLGLYKIGYPRGGPLGVFLGSFIAISIWRYKKVKEIGSLTKSFDKLWFIFQHFLFGILGARTDITLVDWDIIYKGAICLGISITGRIFGSFFMTNWSGLSLRERLFLVTAWLPKGTVQAALGPVALDTAIDLGLGTEYTDLAYKIMNLAVTVIILASTIGSLVLRFAGPRILIRN